MGKAGNLYIAHTELLLSSLSFRILKDIAAVNSSLIKPFSLVSPSLARTPIMEQGALGHLGNLPESFVKETRFSTDFNRNTKFLHERLLFLACTDIRKLRGWLIPLRSGGAFKGYLSTRAVCLGV